MVDSISCTSFFSDSSVLTRNPCATSLDEVELVATARAGAGATAKHHIGPATPGGSDEDQGEDRLLEDFGPGGVNRQDMATKDKDMAAVIAPAWGASNCFDRHITDEHGLRRRILYDPTEMARLLQSHHRSSTAASWRLMVGMIETALDPSKPGCESLLICKAITDAFLVNRGVAAAIDDGNHAGDFFVQSLRQTWQHAVEHWDGYADERHTAADLHLAASWFQAWEASDGTSNQNPTINTYKLHDMLPGDWVWVLDHLEIAGAPGGLHLEEELELEAADEQQLRLPREKWALDDLMRSLLLVSDDGWFQEGEGMIDLRVLGPSRPSTFRRVFSGVPGAIYGCLKDLAGVALTPPTFRMYTTGDILEALGAEVMVRSRDVGEGAAGAVELGEVESNTDPSNSADSDGGTSTATRRQVVSLVEIQVTWVGGYTHVLGWLDSVEA